MKELVKILECHRKWLNDEPGGKRADLQGADLRRADLRGADLRRADLREANLWEANLREANLQRADLQGADLREANLSGAKGLLDPIGFINNNFESIPEGVIVYKIFGSNYNPNPAWKIEPGAVIEEVVNFDRTIGCACGVNVATLEWVKKKYSTRDIWKCLIRWEWLAGVCVPYGTDGKIRASKVQLLEVLKAGEAA